MADTPTPKTAPDLRAAAQAALFTWDGTPPGGSYALLGERMQALRAALEQPACPAGYVLVPECPYDAQPMIGAFLRECSRPGGHESDAYRALIAARPAVAGATGAQPLTGTPRREAYVAAARVYARAYGLHEDAPGYLPRTQAAADEFEPHAWVIAAMQQAYSDGRADGHADGIEFSRAAAQRLAGPTGASIPAGYALVPERATDEMIDAAMENNYVHGSTEAVRACLRDEYRAMIAAAPVAGPTGAPSDSFAFALRALRGELTAAEQTEFSAYAADLTGPTGASTPLTEDDIEEIAAQVGIGMVKGNATENELLRRFADRVRAHGIGTAAPGGAGAPSNPANLLPRAAEMLLGYVEAIKAANLYESCHYIPEIEEVAEGIRSLAAAPGGAGEQSK